MVKLPSTRGDVVKSLGVIITLSTGIFSLFALTFGGYAFLDKRYALAIDHKSLELRVTIGEVEGLHRDAMKEVYFFRKQQRLHPDDYEIQEKLKEAEKESEETREWSLRLKTKQKSLRSGDE